ncbi:MAG TPA: sigma-E factor negative regulatory protein [Rhodanobacteraceae bacterium]|nr:sigma-E factor negative regulatory protein [Rhodanobacteraceae bacterium]
MDPTSREHLSALMDGELGKEPARFLLRRMEHEPELARAWSRWHLIRACLNGERDAIYADPVRLASAAANSDEAFSARVLQAMQARPQARRHWARYIGGGAIAASVAAAALMLSVPQSTSTDTILAAAPAAPERTTSSPARTGLIAAAPVSAKRESAPLPWISNQPPVFLAERPVAASSVPGGGLLQSDYLQQAAYAPTAAPMLMRNPGTATSANLPYMMLLVPDRGAATQVHQH